MTTSSTDYVILSPKGRVVICFDSLDTHKSWLDKLDHLATNIPEEWKNPLKRTTTVELTAAYEG